LKHYFPSNILGNPFYLCAKNIWRLQDHDLLSFLSPVSDTTLPSKQHNDPFSSSPLWVNITTRGEEG